MSPIFSAEKNRMLAQFVQLRMTAAMSSEKSTRGFPSLRHTGIAVNSESNLKSMCPQTEQVIRPTRLWNQSRIWRIWCSLIGIMAPGLKFGTARHGSAAAAKMKQKIEVGLYSRNVQAETAQHAQSA
jgi:hypothetical protein